jgi:hypothetical protein
VQPYGNQAIESNSCQGNADHEAALDVLGRLQPGDCFVRDEQGYQHQLYQCSENADAVVAENATTVGGPFAGANFVPGKK